MTLSMQVGRFVAPKFLALALLVSTAPSYSTLAASAVPVPQGFLNLCTDHPAECSGGGAAQIRLTQSVKATLENVNATVNASITPVKTEMIDVWQVNVTRGDCEEYVLAKRDKLIRLGIDASALRIVYALRNGGGHAILAVMTDQGPLVLDNMRHDIRPLKATGYKIVSMSSANPRIWQRA